MQWNLRLHDQRTLHLQGCSVELQLEEVLYYCCDEISAEGPFGESGTAFKQKSPIS